MQDFRKVQVWQKAHSLTLRTYALSGNFPKTEMFGLTTQFRRAAISVPSNIAEGCSRGGAAPFANHLRIARGSAGEVEYYAILAADLGFWARKQALTYRRMPLK